MFTKKKIREKSLETGSESERVTDGESVMMKPATACD